MSVADVMMQGLDNNFLSDMSLIKTQTKQKVRPKSSYVTSKPINRPTKVTVDINRL